MPSCLQPDTNWLESMMALCREPRGLMAL